MGLSADNIQDDVLIPPVMLQYIPYRLKAIWNETDKKISGVEMPGLVEIDSNFKDKSQFSYSVLDCLKANSADILIVVTMYMEEKNELVRTLNGIWKNLFDF